MAISGSILAFLASSAASRRAEITRVRKQRSDFAQFFESGVDLAQHGLELLLVIGRCDHIHRNDQQASRRHRGLRIITLPGAAAGHRHDA